ncbi:hypothetical protein CU097_001206 [Rhizopus azygosporus]|uniref:Band 7 domain-containing protein n=4 Tax=Rhizopus TaxID=4842 RepID=A0A2G4SQM0_RHIZD|nr:uncharacterized protein RHIMIDRAFT_217123 [Rhizopus microsporus ATCC 52813]ORE08418.1 hypothetical protein BCV72DRAFT_255305 [Rhizopus microsporus var. microsporus]ORE19004.1 hypothetical protein BCV71DRAFT_226637 [Rhizopus microsporus]RCH83723.1 hypothetical protein CU097_001206 [Rhizopus azygosporus]PHZ11078.1 hypothetical protein RHIMIDRAFT_217123 [Rhizopus microsporus ATCC 52813]CEG64507.1 hypothetical protein RMATCC62417_01466 [Rhizopus microsporus]
MNSQSPYPKADDIGIAVRGVQPSYARELDISKDIPHGFYETMMTCIGNTIGFFGAFPCVCCCPNPYEEVRQGNVGLVQKFGKFYKCVDPGLVKVNPVTEEIKRIDITIQVTEIPKQDVITKDNVSISIESVLYWHIVDPYQAVYGVENVSYALVERASTSLRDVCGGHSVQDLIENRNAISHELHKIIGPIAKSWGVKIESTLIKDIILSKSLQESLSSAAQAKRLGESRVISSKADVEAAKLMRDAADILNTPAAIQIRYLETLQAISRNSSGPKTLFVPLPPATNEGP